MPMEPRGSAAARAMGASITSRVSTWGVGGGGGRGDVWWWSCFRDDVAQGARSQVQPANRSAEGKQAGCCTGPSGPPRPRRRHMQGWHPQMRAHRVAKGLERLHEAGHALGGRGAVAVGGAVAIGGGWGGQRVLDGRWCQGWRLGGWGCEKGRAGWDAGGPTARLGWEGAMQRAHAMPDQGPGRWPTSVVAAAACKACVAGCALTAISQRGPSAGAGSAPPSPDSGTLRTMCSSVTSSCASHSPYGLALLYRFFICGASGHVCMCVCVDVCEWM